MYPLPESFNPSFLFGKTVDVISFGPYQIDIYFSENRWIHIEGAYRLLAGSFIVEELMKYPVRQSSLMQILGSTVLNVTYKSNGNLCLEFDCKKQLWICGDNGPYESYRLFDGEREILV
jgi:hypothetical protein